MRFHITSFFFLGIAILGGCSWKGGTGIERADINTLEAETAMQADTENVSYLRMGEFTDQHKAGKLLQRISKIGVSAFIVQEAGLYQVKSGPYVDADQALRHKQELDRMLNIEARVVFE